VRPARVVRGRYDAAQTTSDNERHWANADFLAADMDARFRKVERGQFEATAAEKHPSHSFRSSGHTLPLRHRGQLLDLLDVQA